MFIIRWLLGRLILSLNFLFSPRKKVHPGAVKPHIVEALKGYRLYQYPACPFCVKVRRAMRRSGVELPLVDAKHQASAKVELVEQGGKLKVPCLRMTNQQGDVWLYESDDIIAHLESLVADSYTAAGY